jgi:hypothetical protein
LEVLRPHGQLLPQKLLYRADKGLRLFKEWRMAAAYKPRPRDALVNLVRRQWGRLYVEAPVIANTETPLKSKPRRLTLSA